MAWLKPETKGIPPAARYSHAMEFTPEHNFLIINGGKNDSDSNVYLG